MQKNNKAKAQSNIKKEWYKKWWGVFLIIFVFIPLFFMVFSVTLILNSPRQNNQVTPAQSEQNESQKIKELAQTQELITSTYAPIYCQNHQDTTINEPTLNEQNWPGADNTAGLTDAECQIIIRKLFSERDGYATNIIEKNIKAVSERKVAIGMTKVEVVYAWGSPKDINKTTTGYGTSEQWVFGNPIYSGNYVYFDNDIVTSIQN